MKRTAGPSIGRLAACALACLSTLAGAQQPPPRSNVPVERRPGLSAEQLAELGHVHEGYYGALAPQNLAKKRPKPPFDLTSTWFVDLSRAFADFRFGPPYPEFYEAGQRAMKEAAEAQKKGERYRDSIGQCYPAGMPMIMTRVWPISMVQLPTVIYMMFGFTNSLRIIYLDGREHTDPDIVVPTYDGKMHAYTYDGSGNNTVIKDALNNLTTMTYTGTGRVSTVKDANSRTTSFQYDSQDRLTTITYPSTGGASAITTIV